MKYAFILGVAMMAFSCKSQKNAPIDVALAQQIQTDQQLKLVKDKALEVIGKGFNAGDGYREVWIRDYNTFIRLAAEVHPAETLKENILMFFRMQGEDGHIIDGFTPVNDIGEDETDFSYSTLAPGYAGHKNTVETDQESSLVQTVYKYIQVTGDRSILNEVIGGKSVAARMERSMNFLMEERFSERYGLIWGATTADWGDVQPEHSWGVDLDEHTHRAIDVYDNAMMIIALENMMEILPGTRKSWREIKDQLAKNTRRYLWDEKNQKFIPHLYLEGSPFPPDFDEKSIYYFGGTAIAIEANLLSREEIKVSFNKMVTLVNKAGAPSIGLTIYPPYPDGFFANEIMNPIYSYQNGGDWTWFGGRMILQLIKNGFVKEAYEQIQPMTNRVIENDGFYEWYSIDNQPRGSGTFKGSAGVLYEAIKALEDAATR